MYKILSFVLCLFIGIGYADAAVRDDNSINRQKNLNQQRAGTVQQTATRNNPRATNASRESSSVRNSDTVVSRSAVSIKNSSARTATARNTVIRDRIPEKSTVKKTFTSTRVATTALTASDSNTFGTGYNACRDTYFTCMDQFCSKQDETYRRCVCSSRLDGIKAKERSLSQTQQQLQDFKDLNIDSITKTGNEVKAMLTDTTGESKADSKTDTSKSAEQLNGISAVLNKTKSKSLSTQGKLDIAGDINAIWSTTDLAAGADIMNLTGEKLYNAVHSQCLEVAANSCDSKSNLNMVVSAYGMYIENDCTNLSNALAKQTTTAASTVIETEQEMNKARLNNYDAHNSTSINNCIAQVRKDITADSACGKDYVHCLDITGKYLNSSTGEPIYSSDFYQLELQTSLSGDVLSNQTNRLLVNELNNKKESAKKGLSTCSDLSDEVWDEFMRQAVSEIYQGQQSRIRQVKKECIDVVNNCYDTQSKSLKDFSNVKEQLLLGARLELSEEMCKEKLDACSNLYGGGDSGLTELVTTMQSITDQKIAKDCKTTLEEYATSICTAPSSDIVHGYPFACRTYAPGEQKYASIESCNSIFNNATNFVDSGSVGGNTGGDDSINFCPLLSPRKIYYGCAVGYYMTTDGVNPNVVPTAGNMCVPCTGNLVCQGGTYPPTSVNEEDTTENESCGSDYIGSLYQKVVRYALQTCIRPSESNGTIPMTILADVNVVMDSIKVKMGKELSTECERLGGIWVDTPWAELKAKYSSYAQWPMFYTETSSNTKWGSCVNPSTM